MWSPVHTHKDFHTVVYRHILFPNPNPIPITLRHRKLSAFSYCPLVGTFYPLNVGFTRSKHTHTHTHTHTYTHSDFDVGWKMCSNPQIPSLLTEVSPTEKEPTNTHTDTHTCRQFQTSYFIYMTNVWFERGRQEWNKMFIEFRLCSGSSHPVSEELHSKTWK